MAFTGSLRKTENDWRRHNEVETNQFSIKHGLEFGGNNLLETELVHSQVDMQIPGRLDDAQWESFKDTGKQTDNSSAFKHSARDSKNTALNMRAEIDLDSVTFKPKMYYNEFSHFHPVTGRINDKPGAQIFGTDLELEKPHKFNGRDASLTTGITWRRDSDKGEKKYQYADVETTPDGRIIQTLSNRKGALCLFSYDGCSFG